MRRWTYDTYGNQLSLVDPSAGTSTYTYYGGGELHTQATPLGTSTYYYTDDGRIDYYTNTEGTYDYTYGTNQQVSSVTSPGSVSRSYTYYTNGNVNEISETIESGQTNKVTFVYDSYGRVSTKTYTNSSSTTYTEGYVYNSYGYLDQVTFNGTVVYDVSTMNTRGQITAASIGGTSATWGYNTYGQLTSVAASGVQGYTYTPNTTTGNLTSRTNSLMSLTENFYYDTLDRLDSVQKSSTTTLRLGYDSYGNLVTKSDAGTLVYDGSSPYQVAHVTPYTSNFPSDDQTLTYTSFGKVSTMAEGDYTASFKYNSDLKRIKMVISDDGTAIKTKYYFGGSYEKVIEGTTTTEYIWIGGTPYTAVAVAKIVNGGTPVVYAIFRDHLGTITHLKSSSETLEYSFDAYGRRRDKDTWSYTIDDTNDLFADRGFTGHEYLEEFNLYNMNGRLYDPLVGRFLSPDNYVQASDFTQNFNRYGYCLNNPLRYNDPSGDFITWNIGNGGLSIGLNFTPIGIPLGFGINIGYGDGFAPGVYGEVGYRVGGTGLGSGITVQQSLDYNFKNSSWSTTTSEGAYASLGLFNAGINSSQSYDMTNNQWSGSWGISAGIGFGNDGRGIGFNIGYGSSGWIYGMGGYYNSHAWDSNPVYDECAWNDDGNIQNSNNCYSYALDDPGNPLGGKPQPGQYSGEIFDNLSLEDITTYAICDGYVKKPTFFNKLGFGKRGYYEVYLVIDNTDGIQDYHWYRQDKGGYWSQKHGSSYVTNVDGSGHLIRNPAIANHNYGTYSNGTLNYNGGGIFLWVRKR